VHADFKQEVVMRIVLMVFLSLVSVQTWAHGEDKPGPHGGVITMPGAFHVELVAKSKNQIQAYLLDINWKNPTLKDSSIEVSHGTTPAKCVAKTNLFDCEFPSSIDIGKSGELKVKAVREKQTGMVVTYPLPLKPMKSMKHHH